jgi:hypothetical protein
MAQSTPLRSLLPIAVPNCSEAAMPPEAFGRFPRKDLATSDRTAKTGGYSRSKI